MSGEQGLSRSYSPPTHLQEPVAQRTADDSAEQKLPPQEVRAAIARHLRARRSEGPPGINISACSEKFEIVGCNADLRRPADLKSLRVS